MKHTLTAISAAASVAGLLTGATAAAWPLTANRSVTSVVPSATIGADTMDIGGVTFTGLQVDPC